MILTKHRLYESKIFTLYSRIVSELKESLNKVLDSINLYYAKIGVIGGKDDYFYNKCYLTFLGSIRYVIYIDKFCGKTILTMHHIALLYGQMNIFNYLTKLYDLGTAWSGIIYVDVILRGMYEPLNYINIDKVRNMGWMISEMLENNKYHMYLINYFMLKRSGEYWHANCKNIKVRDCLERIYT